MDTIGKTHWATYMLEEKLTVLKRALHNIDRVHDVHHHAVPLVNNKVTPNGSYDTFYLTKELFKHTPEINETYTRLKRHITKYVKLVNRSLHINSTDGHVT